jgi:hypothetical protein
MSASAQGRARLPSARDYRAPLFRGAPLRVFPDSQSLEQTDITRDMTSLPPGPHWAVQHQMLMLDAITLGHESANNQKGVNEKGAIRHDPGLDKPQTVPGTLQKAHC